MAEDSMIAEVVEEMPPVVATNQLEEDLASLRMLFSWLIAIVIIIAGGIAYVTIKNWLEDTAISGPAGKLLSDQAAFSNLIQLDDVKQLSGQGVTMCIVDTGIDMTHEALRDVELSGWRDFISAENAPYDDQGHGTAMAGVMVAGGGMLSVSPNVELYVAKALSENGSGSDEIVANAIDWCVQQNSDIISLSLGGAPGIIPSAFEGSSSSSAARDATSNGVYVVAAAGNDGHQSNDSDVHSPGGEEDVICVGAVDKNGNLWASSSRGDNNGNLWPVLLPRNDPDKKPELVAPGEQVPVLILDDMYGYSSGTSVSTAYVSASLALLLEAYPELRHDGDSGGQEAVENVKEWLKDSSRPKEGQSDHDDHYGYGLLQIKELLDSASGN